MDVEDETQKEPIQHHLMQNASDWLEKFIVSVVATVLAAEIAHRCNIRKRFAPVGKRRSPSPV